MQAIFVDQPQSGYNVDLSTQKPPRNSMPFLGWDQIASATSQRGDFEEKPQYTTNTSIVYSYTIYPWKDRTHEYIQPGMCVFISKHINSKHRVYNMAPIFKLNIEQRLHHHKATNPHQNTDPEIQTLRNLVEAHGEDILDNHKNLNVTRDPTVGQMVRLASQEKCRYLTKFGILLGWNFIGSCLSKGESTGPAVFLDRHQHTDMVYVVGCVLGERARVGNIWGSRSTVHPGTKLFLILRRVLKADESYGEYQWVPYATDSRDYPPKALTVYRDTSGKLCRAFVLYVGVCTENFSKDPAIGQIERAIGLSGSVQQAYEAHGSLPEIEIRIGI